MEPRKALQALRTERLETLAQLREEKAAAIVVGSKWQHMHNKALCGVVVELGEVPNRGPRVWLGLPCGTEYRCDPQQLVTDWMLVPAPEPAPPPKPKPLVKAPRQRGTRASRKGKG